VAVRLLYLTGQIQDTPRAEVIRSFASHLVFTGADPGGGPDRNRCTTHSQIFRQLMAWLGLLARRALGPNHIRELAGTLEEKKAGWGILITTSRFTAGSDKGSRAWAHGTYRRQPSGVAY
jgi:hypothetical protein